MEVSRLPVYYIIKISHEWSIVENELIGAHAIFGRCAQDAAATSGDAATAKEVDADLNDLLAAVQNSRPQLRTPAALIR